MELLKFCALCVIMAISQLESSKAVMEHMDLITGDPLKIECDTKVPVQRLINDIKHQLIRQPDHQLIFSNIDNENEKLYPSSSYALHLETAGTAVFQYTFTSLKESDSGIWQCLVVSKLYNNVSYIRNMTFNVQPAADVSKVEFSLTKVSGGQEVKIVHEEGHVHDGDADHMTKTVRLLTGAYVMSCASENGYPYPTYSLMLNGQEISTKQVVTLNLTTADTNLACTVTVPRKGFNPHTLAFKLKIEEVEPKINCTTTSARINDRRAVMNCTVVAADVTCKKVVWKPGTTNDDIVHRGEKVEGYELSCKSNGDNSVWSALEIEEVQQKHFDDSYFIKIKDSNIGDFQKEHQLLRKPGALNGSVQMTSLGSLALLTVVTLLKMVL